MTNIPPHIMEDRQKRIAEYLMECGGTAEVTNDTMCAMTGLGLTALKQALSAMERERKILVERSRPNWHVGETGRAIVLCERFRDDDEPADGNLESTPAGGAK